MSGRTPATRRKTSRSARTDTKGTDDILATIETRAADMSADTATDIPEVRPGSPVATFSDGRTPDVLSGRVATEHVDPNAERALKDPAVATDYNEAKTALREYGELEGRRTEALKRIARSLMALRGHFKEPGSRGRRTDWNGESAEYQALAKLLYQDVGLEGATAESAKRAVRHHVEDVKRELVPKTQWEHFGVQALTRGQRQALAARFGREDQRLEEESRETAGKAATGAATGAQLVSLAKRIDSGISVFSAASLRTLTPTQRTTFRQQVEDTRARADALLRELESLD